MAGYIYIGKRIYYLKVDGRVILDTGEAEGWVNKTTPEQDWEIYTDLQKYSKTEVDYVELQFGELKTEFAECTSYRVNPSTKELEFDYTPVPEPPDVPQTPTIHERVQTLEKNNSKQDDMIFEQSYEIAMLKLNTTSASSLE